MIANRKRYGLSPKHLPIEVDDTVSNDSKRSSLTLDVSQEMAAVCNDLKAIKGSDRGSPYFHCDRKMPSRELTRTPKDKPLKEKRIDQYLNNEQLSSLVEETKSMVNNMYTKMLTAHQRPYLMCRSCSFSHGSCTSSCGRQMCTYSTRVRDCRHLRGHFHDTSCILDVPPCPTFCHKPTLEKPNDKHPKKTLKDSEERSNVKVSNNSRRDACCSPVKEVISLSEAEINSKVASIKGQIASVISHSRHASSPLPNRSQINSNKGCNGFYASPCHETYDNSFSFSDDYCSKNILPLDGNPESVFSLNFHSGRRKRIRASPGGAMHLGTPRRGEGDENRRAIVWEVLSGLIVHKDETTDCNRLVDERLCFDVMKKITQFLLANDVSQKYSNDWSLLESKRRHLHNIQTELSVLEELEPPPTRGYRA